MGVFSYGRFLIIDTAAAGAATSGTIPAGALNVVIYNLGATDAKITYSPDDNPATDYLIAGNVNVAVPVQLNCRNSQYNEITYDAQASARLVIAVSY